MENRKKYNGIEFENDLDLNIYDAQFRELDPQIGSWWEIDPKVDEMYQWSAYASNFDNPIRYEDHLGDTPNGNCCKWLSGAVDALVDKAKAIASIPGQVINHPINTLVAISDALDPVKSTYNFGKNLITKTSENVKKEGVGYAITYGITSAVVDVAAAKGVAKIAGAAKAATKIAGAAEGVVNSKGVGYPKVVVEGLGEVPFPKGLFTPNNSQALRSQFTPKLKGEFKDWWIQQGRPWPNVPEGSSLNIHHIKPLGNGGTNSFNNLVPLIQPQQHQPFTNWRRGF